MGGQGQQYGDEKGTPECLSTHTAFYFFLINT